MHSIGRIYFKSMLEQRRSGKIDRSFDTGASATDASHGLDVRSLSRMIERLQKIFCHREIAGIVRACEMFVKQGALQEDMARVFRCHANTAM
jgi:hypothetical protein